jgi:hypothetical protein
MNCLELVYRRLSLISLSKAGIHYLVYLDIFFFCGENYGYLFFCGENYGYLSYFNLMQDSTRDIQIDTPLRKFGAEGVHLFLCRGVKEIVGTNL